MLRLSATCLLTATLLCGQAPPRRVDLIVRGGAVLTMDSSHRIIDPGLVAVDGGRIVAVASVAEAASRFISDRVINATGRAVLPGLVNLHTHSSMIFLRGLADDYSL